MVRATMEFRGFQRRRERWCKAWRRLSVISPRMRSTRCLKSVTWTPTKLSVASSLKVLSYKRFVISLGCRFSLFCFFFVRWFSHRLSYRWSVFVKDILCIGFRVREVCRGIESTFVLEALEWILDGLKKFKSFALWSLSLRDMLFILSNGRILQWVWFIFDPM